VSVRDSIEQIVRRGGSEREYFPEALFRYILKQALASGLERLDRPIYATWNVITQCNLHCSFCSAGARATGGMISNPVAPRIARMLSKVGVRHVALLGGEPTLCEELGESVAIMDRCGVFVELVTNGSGLDLQLARVLLHLGPRVRVKVSLDSYDEETNDSMRGRGAFRYAVDACAVLASVGVPFRVQSVITEANELHIAATMAFANDLGARSYGFTPVIPMGRAAFARGLSLSEAALSQVADLMVNADRFSTALEKFSLGCSWMAEIESASARLAPLNAVEADLNSRLKCNALRTRVHVDANGDVYPCDYLKDERFRCGNLLADEFAEIWGSSVARVVNGLRRANKERCRQCERYTCDTGCAAVVASVSRHDPSVVAFCDLCGR